MSLLRVYVPAIVVFVASVAQAEINCEKITNYKEVISCAEQRSPDVLKAEGVLKTKAALVESAAQFLNPDLSIQSVSGTQDSDRKVETDVGLSFPIELGGKRSARKKVASVEEAKAQWDLYRAKSEVRKEVFVKLLRLKHIERELELVDESIDTFTKLVKQYESRPARSPEQEVSLTVFKIAQSEYNFKRTEYDQEVAALESYFQLTTGLSLATLKKAALPEITTWPNPPAKNDNLKASPLAAAYEFEVQSARGELDVEKGSSWPTLNVGPSVKFTKEAGREFQQWGFNLSMPLPVFNANGSGRAAAHAAVQSAEQRRDLSMKQLEADRKLLTNTYSKAVLSLAQSPNGRVLEGKHKKIETMFLRGVVPSSLVIESHRSLVDFEKARNEHEVKALNALFSIQLIDGETVGVAL